MSEPVQAWALLCLLFGGVWAVVMFFGLIAIDRRFFTARVLLGTFAFLGLALAGVGALGLTLG